MTPGLVTWPQPHPHSRHRQERMDGEDLHAACVSQASPPPLGDRLLGAEKSPSSTVCASTARPGPGQGAETPRSGLGLVSERMDFIAPQLCCVSFLLSSVRGRLRGQDSIGPAPSMRPGGRERGGRLSASSSPATALPGQPSPRAQPSDPGTRASVLGCLLPPRLTCAPPTPV